MIERVVIILLLAWISYRYKCNFDRVPKYDFRYHHMFDYPFETGDLILCQQDRFVSSFCGNCFHHAGIVYKDPSTSQLLLWHMCAPLTILLGAGRHRYGIMLEPLYRVLAEHKRCVVRKLHTINSRCLSKEWMYQQKNSVNFFSSTYMQVLARRSWLPWTCERGNEQSCAHLVCTTYAAMNILQTYDPNLLPEDLWDESQKSLVFLPGSYLDPPRPLHLVPWYHLDDK